MSDTVRDRAEWLARTLIRGDQFITVGVLESGDVRVGYGKGAYVLTVRDEEVQARVEELTAALFELVGVADRVIHHEGIHGVTWMGLLTNKVAECRAVLARAAK
jgi:hypothetical protein